MTFFLINGFDQKLNIIINWGFLRAVNKDVVSYLSKSSFSNIEDPILSDLTMT